MDNSELFSFGFDYGRRVIPIQPLTYWKLVPLESTKTAKLKEKKEEQKLEIKAKICCRSCIDKVKEVLDEKFPGITDVQVDRAKSKIVVVGKVEDRSAVLKKVKKVFRGAKFETEIKSTDGVTKTTESSKKKGADAEDDSGDSANSKSKSTTTSKDQLVQYYVQAPPSYHHVPPTLYYYQPNQMWPYSYPPPPPYYYYYYDPPITYY